VGTHQIPELDGQRYIAVARIPHTNPKLKDFTRSKKCDIIASKKKTRWEKCQEE
jgi:hypothetical protein